MDLDLRERRRRAAANETRKRAWVAFVLALAAHAAGVPLLVLVFTARGPAAFPPAPAEKVTFRQIPAAEWDATMGAARGEGPRPQQQPPTRQPPQQEEEKKPEPPKPERAPGQVVETAPGNGEEDPNAKLAAESSNRVERETIARERSPGNRVTMPRQTTAEQQAEAEAAPTPAPGKGEGLALGEASEGKSGQEAPGSRVEIPSVEKQDELALKEDPGAQSGFRNRESSEALRGNSDRFRLQVGEGEGEGEAGSEAAGGDGKPLALFPSRASLDRITGGPAPDHVDGMAEGDGTFLNTREWRYASFFNRVKRNVSETWNPIRELRRRDPTGEIYAWKDRQTLLTVVLEADGRVAEMYVEQSSGVDFLDREALAAFERAQPFPNPPRGLVDERGQIRFQFGFYLQTGRAGFRIFRGR